MPFGKSINTCYFLIVCSYVSKFWMFCSISFKIIFFLSFSCCFHLWPNILPVHIFHHISEIGFHTLVVCCPLRLFYGFFNGILHNTF